VHLDLHITSIVRALHNDRRLLVLWLFSKKKGEARLKSFAQSLR